eukprot:gene9059-biopygen19690
MTLPHTPTCVPAHVRCARGHADRWAGAPTHCAGDPRPRDPRRGGGRGSAPPSAAARSPPRRRRPRNLEPGRRRRAPKVPGIPGSLWSAPFTGGLGMVQQHRFGKIGFGAS